MEDGDGPAEEDDDPDPGEGETIAGLENEVMKAGGPLCALPVLPGDVPPPLYQGKGSALLSIHSSHSCRYLHRMSQRKKATIHQLTTVLFTSKNVLFPCHNYLLTTGADDPSLELSPKHQCRVIHTGG